MKNLLFIFFLFTFTCSAQNLVPNPSFEECYKCPKKENVYIVGRKYRGKPRDIKYWEQPTTGNFDYFNQCSPNHLLSTPQNVSGFQIPRTGKAYVGIFLFNGTNYKEYIQARLIDTLEKGEKYFVRLYYVYDSKHNTSFENTIGIYFSSEKIHSKDNGPFPYKPQITHSDPDTVNETETWLPACGIYTAVGGEQYITIGNFKNLDAVDIDKRNTTSSYIYIDDVSVEKIHDKFNCDCNTDSSKISIPFNSKIISNDSICNLFMQQIKIGSLYLLSHFSFFQNSFKMKNDTTNELNSLSIFLTKNENIEIEIYSHSNKMRSEEQSYELTTERAKAIADYLIKQGISKNRISYIGYGATMPVAKYNTHQEKEKNERIEFRIIKK